MTATTTAATDHPPPRDVAGQLLRLLFRLTPAAVWTTDAHLRITQLIGRVPGLHAIDANAVTMTVQDLVGGDASDRSVSAHAAALTGQSQSFDYVLGGRWFRVLVDPLRDAGGAIVGCIGAAVDATRERQIDEDLADTERRVEEAQRVAHVGSFVWDVRADHVTWSNELCRIYGVERRNLSGTFDEMRAFVLPDDEASFAATMARVVREPQAFAFDQRIVRSDGAVRVLHTQGEVIADSGAPVRVVAECWDVTETAEAHAQEQRSRSLLEATLNATADGILVVAADGRVTAYNPRFLTMWQLSHDAMSSATDEVLLDRVNSQLEDPEKFLRRVRDLYAQPETEDNDLLRFKDGRVFERYSRPLHTGSKITGRVWSFRDVTERERLLEGAVFIADASRLLATLDAEAALVAVAHLAVPFLGETCSVDLASAQDEEPRRLVVVSALDGSIGPRVPGAVHHGHASFFQWNGRAALAVPLSVGGNVAGVIALVATPSRKYDEKDLKLCEDLAQRVSLTLANSFLYREAAEALRSRDEFLAIAAHEIRGPIASMHLALQTLRKKGSSLPRDRLLKIVQHDEQRLTRFVDELLDVGRIRTGTLTFTYEDVDIAAVVRDVADRLATEIAASKSSLTIKTAPAVVGQWDRTRIEQIVSNLMSNAIKFGRGGDIIVTLSADANIARFEVTDHGLGIPREEQPRIFEPFERLVSPRHYGGLGLGLHIVRVLVRGLGGSVRVVSTPGVGSTFTVELPMQRGS